MKKLVSIIVGGTGQFGLITSQLLLKKNYKVIITTRTTKNKKKIKQNKKLILCKLNIYNKKEMGLEKTKFIKDTLNPKWNEDFVLNKVMPDYTGVLLQVWDHEEVLSKDNFLVSIFFLNIIKKKIIFFFVNGK